MLHMYSLKELCSLKILVTVKLLCTKLRTRRKNGVTGTKDTHKAIIN